MTNGWFRIDRKLFDNDIWLMEPFTRAQAWIDLIGNANHRDGVVDIRGNIVKIGRGQIGWSEVTMAKRWTWSRNRVRRFLKWLEAEQQIEQQKDRYITSIITIRNYDKYQSDTADDTAERQQKDSRRNINKNVKKNKNVKNISPYPLIGSIRDKEIQKIADTYKVPVAFVLSRLDDMENWLEATGKRHDYYKDYYRALCNWVKRDALQIKQDYAKRNSEVAI